MILHISVCVHRLYFGSLAGSRKFQVFEVFRQDLILTAQDVVEGLTPRIQEAPSKEALGKSERWVQSTKTLQLPSDRLEVPPNKNHRILEKMEDIPR